LSVAGGRVPQRFTFAELFAGVGGFRLGLEALGGICVFSNEIDQDCVRAYTELFGNESSVLHVGDVCKVSSDSIPDHDLLVGGFPCQPFSKEGLQPGIHDPRGLLFRELVRILRDKRPKHFLFENVPGLLSSNGGGDYKMILQEFEVESDYRVHAEVINAKCLTPQSRKRLYFMGTREDIVSAKDPSQVNRFPFIPDLRLRAGDFLDRESLPADEGNFASLDDYTLSDEQFSRLRNSRAWQSGGPNGRLLWDDKICETLISNYGNTVGNGNHILVPRKWPHNPRRLTVAECSRLMGFPSADGMITRTILTSSEVTEDKGYPKANTWFKAWYRMFGNAVCPPLIASPVVVCSGTNSLVAKLR